MTTIAYRDGVLAADTLATSNDVRDDYGPKIWRVGRLLVGASGSRPLCLRFRDWVANGMGGESPFYGDNKGNGIVIAPDSVVAWSESGSWPVAAPFYSLGSGYQLAMGAMEMGATAEQAVAASIKHDCLSGGEITVLSLAPRLAAAA